MLYYNVTQVLASEYSVWIRRMVLLFGQLFYYSFSHKYKIVSLI